MNLKRLLISIVIVTLSSCSTEKNTPKTAPQLTTTTVSNISLISATSGGNVTSDGDEAVTARGIVWNTITAPTTNLSTKTIDGAGIGIFSSSITNLIPSSTYFVKAYATNSVGTAYGNELSFTTGAIVLPTISTTVISGITTTTAVSGGNITADGGGNITSRGVVWNTTTGATIALSTKTTDRTGTSTFSNTLTGLTPNTNYYVRAYATNSSGTNYGNEISFKTAAPPALTVTDIDGNIYKTVTICNQIWTETNLNVSKYRNGDIIPEVTDPTQWRNLTIGAWCYYLNNTANGPIYGKLYNWYAVNDSRGLAPTGYHIPSDAEFTILTTCLGGESIAGDKMKETSSTHWIIPNTLATNASGFTALPGGVRGSSGPFNQIGETCNIWSTTVASDVYSNVWCLTLFNNQGYTYKTTPNYGDACSVRCLRD